MLVKLLIGIPALIVFTVAAESLVHNLARWRNPLRHNPQQKAPDDH